MRILGIDVDALTMAQAVAAFGDLIARRHPSLVFSLNVDLCMKVQRDEGLRAIYRAADLVLVDGTPMMWAARFLGSPLPERVSGSDFVPIFSKAAARQGYRIFLLGGHGGVAEGAKRRLEATNPGLKIVGTYTPPFPFGEHPRENALAIRAVRSASPDVLFVALGPSREQRWLFRFRDELGVPVSMGVGSSLDYLAGRLRRAPPWMQRLGLEWSYRLAQEPRRLWRRYLFENPPFVYYVMREWLHNRGSKAFSDPSPL